jgi:GNAT superfamily N-acetyltransferase
MTAPPIVAARLADASAMLALQRHAFEPEALASRSREIPPLQETLADIEAHLRAATVLKAMDGDRLVGAIRGVVEGDTCVVRVLVVAEDQRGQGLGARLLAAIEAAHPRVARFELTTNMVMAGNVRFYLRHGYAVVEERQHAPTIRLAFMRKTVRPAQ